MATDSNELAVVDVSDPAQPTTVGRAGLPIDCAAGVALYQDWAVVMGGREMVMVDVALPEAPQVVGRANLRVDASASRVVVQDRYAYVAMEGLVNQDWAVVMGGREMVMVDVARPEAPQVVGRANLRVDASASRVVVQDRYAYVAMEGLVIVDIADPTFPQLVGAAFSGRTVEVAAEGDYAYLAEGRDGMQVVDLSNPAEPRRLGGFVPAGVIGSLAIRGTTAFLANRSWGLQAVDVSDPHEPRLMGENSESGRPAFMALADGAAYVCMGEGLGVFDISDPQTLEQVGGERLAESPQLVRVAGDTAVTLCNEGVESGKGLRVYDVRDPASVQLLGEHGLSEAAMGMDVVDGHCYAGLTWSARLEIVDLGNPREPKTVAIQPLPGLRFISAVRASGKQLYVCGGSTLEVFDLSNPVSPLRVSQYQDDDLMEGFHSITVQGDRVFLTAGDAGLFVLSAYEPSLSFLPGSMRADELGMHLFFQGPGGRTVLLERSEDLRGWQPWLTRTASGAPEEAVDSTPSPGARMFYRISAP